MPGTQTSSGLKVLQRVPEDVSAVVRSGIGQYVLVCSSMQGVGGALEREDDSEPGLGSQGWLPGGGVL